MNQTGYIFLSHSTKDKATVEAVRKMLENNGIQTWVFYRDTRGGDYPSQIIKAIDNCDGMILFLSRSSQKSNDVYSEVHEAHTCHKEILPVYLDDTALNEKFRYHINTVHSVRFRETGEKSPEMTQTLAWAERISSFNDDELTSHFIEKKFSDAQKTDSKQRSPEPSPPKPKGDPPSQKTNHRLNPA